MDAGDLGGLQDRGRRQDADQPPGEHGLARPGRSDQQQVVAAGGGVQSGRRITPFTRAATSSSCCLGVYWLMLHARLKDDHRRFVRSSSGVVVEVLVELAPA